MTDTQNRSDPVSISFRNILFSTDFSDVSAKALPYAAATARRFHSKLHVVHVIAPERRAGISSEGLEAALMQQQQEAEKSVATLLTSSHFRGIDHEVVLARGELWPTLSIIAAERNIDLLVAGSHGKYGFEKLVSGSTAEEFLSLAARPLLLVGPNVMVTPEAEVHLERILCAIDFRPEYRRVMEYAGALAKAYGARLYFLHAAAGDWTEVSANMPARDFFQLRLKEMDWPEPEQGVQPEFLVLSGPLESLILELVSTRQIQLVVLNAPTKAHSDLAAHLPGPLAYNVMSRAVCPVLTVRGAPEEGDFPR